MTPKKNYSFRKLVEKIISVPEKEVFSPRSAVPSVLLYFHPTVFTLLHSFLPLPPALAAAVPFRLLLLRKRHGLSLRRREEGAGELGCFQPFSPSLSSVSSRLSVKEKRKGGWRKNRRVSHPSSSNFKPSVLFLPLPPLRILREDFSLA